jgi:hypothetical protein
MNTETFNTIVQDRVAKIQATLIKKAAEYASDKCRLHNFKVAARMEEPADSPESALWGMMRKHLVSVLDIVAATRNGKYPTAAMRDEKIGDAINYLILLEALLIEHSPVEKRIEVHEGTNATMTRIIGEGYFMDEPQRSES